MNFEVFRGTIVHDRFELADFAGEIEHEKKSAVTSFYRCTELIRDGIDVAGENELLKASLLLSVFSSTECYFRDVLSDTLVLCPLSKRTASFKMISLGASLWDQKNPINPAVFENFSFSTELKKFREILSDYFNLKFKDSDSLAAAYLEYEKLNELRHSLIHCNGYLWGKNANKLNATYPGETKRLKVQPTAYSLQAAISLCSNLVFTFNEYLSEEIFKRVQVNLGPNPGRDAALEVYFKTYYFEKNPSSYELDFSEFLRKYDEEY